MNSKIKDKDIKFELPKPLFRNNRYNNPWDTWKDVTISNLAHYQFFAKDDSDLPNKNVLLLLLLYILNKIFLKS